MNFQIPGDLAVTEDRTAFVRCHGVDRRINRLRTLFGIARGSFEYSPIGVRWFDAIGHPMHKGRLRSILREAALSDPEVSDVQDIEIYYVGNRAYAARMRSIVEGKLEVLDL